MTDAAKHVINCVYEARGRYGKNIIMDTLLGSKTARLVEVGAMEYKSYGVLSDLNKNLLRRLLEQLLLDKYLVVGHYQELKLGDISPLKKADAKILLKISDDDKRSAKKAKPKKTVKGMEALTRAGYKLFDDLRELRLAIAREENMPPYIIFNDRTLIDMSVKVPMTREEMLNVSGVGENKFEKYGERFLCIIEKMVGEYPELLENRSAKTGSRRSGKAWAEDGWRSRRPRGWLRP